MLHEQGATAVEPGHKAPALSNACRAAFIGEEPSHILSESQNKTHLRRGQMFVISRETIPPLSNPQWYRWLAYLVFTQETRVRVPAGENLFVSFFF